MLTDDYAVGLLIVAIIHQSNHSQAPACRNMYKDVQHRVEIELNTQ
jgi:hypothetical protein